MLLTSSDSPFVIDVYSPCLYLGVYVCPCPICDVRFATAIFFAVRGTIPEEK